MPTTFTATPDGIASGGAVVITEPLDGDLATVASILASIEKLANIDKKLVNQVPLFGVAPSVLDANMGSGVLFTTEADSDGAKVRFISRIPGVSQPREFLITRNAQWTNAGGGRWLYDSVTVDAWLIGLHGPGTVQGASMMQYDTSLGNSWNDAAWNSAYLSAGGVAQPSGLGIIATQTPIAVSSFSGGYKNSWAAYTGGPGGSAGNYEGIKVYKDPTGRTCFSGAASGGSTGTIAFTLPAAYWPNAFRALGATNQSSLVVPETASITISKIGDVTITFSGGGSSTIVSLDGLSYFN